MKTSSAWKDRLRAACLAVCLLLCAPFCVSALLGGAQKGALAREVVQGASSEQKAAFAYECIDLNDAKFSAVRFLEEPGIWGFECSLSPDETLDYVCSQLEGNSWTRTSFEKTTQAVFCKSEGTYRWLYVSCGWVNGVTVVVCQVS